MPRIEAQRGRTWNAGDLIECLLHKRQSCLETTFVFSKIFEGHELPVRIDTQLVEVVNASWDYVVGSTKFQDINPTHGVEIRILQENGSYSVGCLLT